MKIFYETFYFYVYINTELEKNYTCKLTLEARLQHQLCRLNTIYRYTRMKNSPPPNMST